MSRCAMACQRRQCKRRLRSRLGERGRHRKRENDSKRFVREDRIRQQTGVDGREPKAFQKILADNDIHRLVRVTA